MSTVGARLREAREAKRMTLSDVSIRTKISLSNLEIIEADRFEQIPGNTFLRGFVRCFACEVGLDADELLRRMEQQVLSASGSRLKPVGALIGVHGPGLRNFLVLIGGATVLLTAILLWIFIR